MPTLYLVRHGQASFGAADYDQLSDLGARQCRRLGEHWAARGRRFQAVMRGTLNRHRQSLQALAEGLPGLPAAEEIAALNEYDSAAVVRAIHPEPLPRDGTAEGYRHHFRVLRQGLQAWMEGRTAPVGMPAYADFAAGVAAVLERVRSHDGDVLVMSSGGPISTAVGLVLGVAPTMGIELNLRLRNSSVCELSFNPKRHVLHAFNHLPHLDEHADAGWITYA
ncbi:MAG: histidine phosphatase family protein [Rubrivivax sp.]